MTEHDVIAALWHMLEIPLILTGEILLFVLTLGRHRPRWDLYESERGSRWAALFEASWWIGALFCVGVVVLVRMFWGT